MSEVEELVKEWNELGEEYKSLEIINQTYLELLDEFEDLQSKCTKEIGHQRYRIAQLARSLKDKQIKTAEEKLQLAELNQNIIKRKAQLYEIEQSLPQKNSLYLKIILGNVNVSILSRSEKLRYKDEYEKFKFILNCIGLAMSVLNLIFNNRALELAFLFLLVWYYCTLTIRESILKVNGSRIKGWWRLHHFISTVSAAVLLIWPQGEHWQMFRTQFMYFNVYISVIQYIQFGYQKGLLYRLKALGERQDMDITIEGFHTWMWKGLSFLLPFLFVGYFYQAYNSYILYKLSNHGEAPWQVSVLSLLFFTLFIGNTCTTLVVIPQKLRGRIKEKYRLKSVSWAMKIREKIKGEKAEKNRLSVSESFDDGHHPVQETSKTK